MPGIHRTPSLFQTPESTKIGDLAGLADVSREVGPTARKIVGLPVGADLAIPSLANRRQPLESIQQLTAIARVTRASA